MITAYWVLLAIILALLVTSAFFSGSETALTAASRARMHQLEKNGDEAAGMVTDLIEKRDRLIGALLIGNNLVNILASALATSLFLQIFGEGGVLVATMVMTILVVIFAEVMPKSWAFANADRFAITVAPVLRIVVAALSPFAAIVTGIVRGIFKIFGVGVDEEEPLLSAHEEIRGAVEVLHRDGSVYEG